MKTSEETKDLFAALAKAQGEMENAPLNKENPHFKAKYADLQSVRDTTMPALSKNDLALTQAPEVRDGAFVLVTRLAHKTGQWIEAEYPLPQTLERPQQIGSALTYARRYSWSCIVGIASVEDDDAQYGGTGRVDGPDEVVVGALGKTKLQAQLREFDQQMNGCDDLGEFEGLVYSYDAILKQAERDLPSWMKTKQGSDTLGILDRIEKKRKELQDPDKANMEAPF